MIVYRYMSEQYGLLALQQKEWKIARLFELNDPLDCQPVALRGGKTLEKPEDEWLLRTVQNQVGILCFSAKIDDPVIWSHYADSHRGIALGYEIGSDNPASAVEYPEPPEAEKRPVVNLDVIELNNQGDYLGALTDLVVEGFTTKAASWAYEQEYRQEFLLTGSDCAMKGTHYFRKYLVEKLQCVVLGARSRLTNQEINDSFRGRDFSLAIQVKRAKVDPLSFKLRIEDV